MLHWLGPQAVRDGFTMVKVGLMPTNILGSLKPIQEFDVMWLKAVSFFIAMFLIS